ncbi:(2Fe-2S)-binding protein [Muricoccus radiodurans]|uniref:(2Fe-2S)-binding protein n=1 Tax=Muricoccus radiodurans TaxID=2231721 RepID=UPI003CF7C340
MTAGPLLHRVLPRRTPRVTIRIDGTSAEAHEGESLLLAVLAHGAQLRLHEVDGAPRAGFCLMGACQDCWIWTPSGQRLRACTTTVTAGLEVLTRPPEAIDA